MEILEQVITETESSVLELIISESVKDMFLHEEEDLEPILADIENGNLSDLFYEKFIPYFINNTVVLNEAITLQNLKNNAKQNITYYKNLLGKKLKPTNFLNAVKKGVGKATKSFNDSNIGKAVVGGLLRAKKTVGTQVAKRLGYASQNLQNAAKVVNQKIK